MRYYHPYRHQNCTLYGIEKRRRSHLDSTTATSVHTQILSHKKVVKITNEFQIKNKRIVIYIDKNNE